MENQIIFEKQDLKYLSWDKLRKSSGTAGSFLKSYSELSGIKTYYKLSNYDTINGVIGYECINEIIVDRLLTLLGVEHLNYQLINAEIVVDEKTIETYLCASENFRTKDEDKQALDVYYQNEKLESETPLQFCARLGFEEYIYTMLVVDFLILNRDRHGANIEILRDKKKKTLRLAPLFDHGLSLLFNCYSDKDIDKFDVLADLPVQCFVGSRSAKDNLRLIPKDKIPKLNPIKESDKEFILQDLDKIVPTKMLEKIWEMIWKRWCYYEDFCNT